MRDDVALIIGGTEYRGWQSVSITRSLETLAASFTLGMADPRTSEPKPRPFEEFMPVAIFIGGDLVLTGIIDEIAPSYSGHRHSISLSGRSLTGQLADCSADVPTGELRNVSIGAVARRLCGPFGISVIMGNALAAQPFDRVQIEPGETVVEVLERLARQRGVFLTDDANGNLVITRRGETVQGSIESGVSGIISMKGRFNGAERHDTVTVKGQRTGSDTWGPKAASAPVGVSQDAGVPLHRPLVVLSETQGDDAAFQERARYETALRKGRSRRWTYELQDWRRADGALWESGRLAAVTDPLVNLNAALLVVETAFTRDQSGTRVEMVLAQPEGYDLRAIPEVREESTAWNSSESSEAGS